MKEVRVNKGEIKFSNIVVKRKGRTEKNMEDE